MHEIRSLFDQYWLEDLKTYTILDQQGIKTWDVQIEGKTNHSTEVQTISVNCNL